MPTLVALSCAKQLPSPGLRDLTRGRLFVGGAVNYGYLTGIAQGAPMPPWDVANYSAVIAQEFNVVTAENGGKVAVHRPAARSLSGAHVLM